MSDLFDKVIAWAIVTTLLYTFGHIAWDFVTMEWNWPLSDYGYRVWAVLSVFATTAAFVSEK